MTKKYKPGQFCSLGGRFYRVKKRAVFGSTCDACGYKCVGSDRDPLFGDCATKLPYFCYPIEVKPKH